MHWFAAVADLLVDILFMFVIKIDKIPFCWCPARTEKFYRLEGGHGEEEFMDRIEEHTVPCHCLSSSIVTHCVFLPVQYNFGIDC